MTLLLDTQIRLAKDLARDAPPWRDGTEPQPARVTHVKMRAFILPGQHLALSSSQVDGVRRNYSICAPATEGRLRIGVKRLSGGAFSTHATSAARGGPGHSARTKVCSRGSS